MSNKSTMENIIVNGVSRQEVENGVRSHFKKFFTEYSVSDKIIEVAVDDVFECSAIEDEGFYTGGDISLGCQRAIIIALGEEI